MLSWVWQFTPIRLSLVECRNLRVQETREGVDTVHANRSLVIPTIAVCTSEVLWVCVQNATLLPLSLDQARAKPDSIRWISFSSEIAER